jgi:hypothetical protein
LSGVEADAANDHTCDITTVPASMTPFPPIKSEFVADQLELGYHLHPLFSLDIGTVNPEWSGVLHMLSPLEPYESLVGELTEWDGYHGDLLNDWLKSINWPSLLHFRASEEATRLIACFDIS